MSKAKLKPNIRLLRRVQKHILAEPRRIKMKTWVDRDTIERQWSAKPPCGTTACIAGWALTLSGKRLRKQTDYMCQGRELLELTRTQAESLFLVDEWPAKFRDRYNQDAESCFVSGVPTGDIEKNARVTVARIEHFIKTGE